MDRIFDKNVMSIILQYVEQCVFCEIYEDIYETCLSTTYKTVCLECGLDEIRKKPIPCYYRPSPLRKRLKCEN